VLTHRMSHAFEIVIDVARHLSRCFSRDDSSFRLAQTISTCSDFVVIEIHRIIPDMPVLIDLALPGPFRGREGTCEIELTSGKRRD
jgi:hypothetical protein